MDIDVSFDFTTDTPGYWDGFLDRDGGLANSAIDPDFYSPTLKRYHQTLWSKLLPNGEVMDWEWRKPPYYLTWKDFAVGSDAITTSFRYFKYKPMIERVKAHVGDYKVYYEGLLRKSYTIGGTIIIPVHRNSMNQMRGMNAKISDRWDLTLECIRKYYLGEESSLYKTILGDKAFFDLFVDFRGYVDFFFLQDCVEDDYSGVKLWCGNAEFKKSALPETLEDYFKYIDAQMEFVRRRNERIMLFCNN